LSVDQLEKLGAFFFLGTMALGTVHWTLNLVCLGIRFM